MIAGVLAAHLVTALALPSPRPVAMSAADVVHRLPWHGAGAAQWRRMRGITPRSYQCRRVDPARPISLDDGDVRSAAAWAHAQWSEEFVDIEGGAKKPPTL